MAGRRASGVVGGGRLISHQIVAATKDDMQSPSAQRPPTQATTFGQIKWRDLSPLLSCLLE